MKALKVSLMMTTCALTACGTTDDETFEPRTARAAAALAATQPMRVISHNVEGCPGGHAGDPAFLTSIKNQIDTWKPHVVGLQEVGWKQFDDLKKTYEPQGWSLRFESLRRTGPVSDPNSVAKPHPSCTFGTVEGQEPYHQGQVLMVKGTLTQYKVADLPFVDGDKHFTLQCGEFVMAGFTKTVRACNTHLAVAENDPDLSGKRRQLEAIKALTDPHVASKIVVLTGDFNIGPASAHMDNIYRLTRGGSHTGLGEFREADQTDGEYCPDGACRDMQPTKGNAKLDYVFFNRQTCANATLSGGVVAVQSTESDHDIKRGRCDITG
ncbi:MULTISPECIES: endonuclease/exonuclease/phosphatase family protein [unclassified Corallococcus]|uniref:endonuclease/exonuclease/phosphatase family protein n=1 Tax=unclassified Corallococcus TaxID=2685029 RepID=UPI001A8F605D|nr:MULTISPECIES: endonuclease/exonuclease/phosphatase family protein [unclassified Corallococcus]MBN9684443.1 endonuclease/exonuclease/phosphatase family protein [Corallococcus sp. NCSPR001]WAS84080.1 endonuclease/exonuclease/phosphatase family protein [Corallococcus sp. NCRR]